MLFFCNICHTPRGLQCVLVAPQKTDGYYLGFSPVVVSISMEIYCMPLQNSHGVFQLNRLQDNISTLEWKFIHLLSMQGKSGIDCWCMSGSI